MRQEAESEALRLIGLAYDTALGGHGWTDMLRPLAASINAKSAMLRMVDYTERQVGFFDTVGYHPSMPQAYRERLIEIDPYRHTFETSPIGKLTTADEVLGHDVRRRGEYYNDFERLHDIEYLVGTTLSRSSTATIQIGIHRSKQSGDFEPEALSFLELVLPHLVRAVQMRQLIASASCQQMLAESALNQLRVGVVLANGQARPLFVNRAAEQMIDASRGALSLSLRSLKTRDSRSTAQLCRMIADAASTTAGKALSTGGEMRVECGGTFLQLCVVPLSRQRLGSEFPAPAACAAIFISRPSSLDLPWHKIAVCYGLTPAEAKLAVQLAKGGSLEEAAGLLGVSYHTARSQLKSVFAKTGARRQSELVALLLQGVLAWCHPDEGAA